MGDKFMYLPRFFIDSHVHGRDMEQSYKTTILQTMREALSAGIRISIFMPNTDPAIIEIGVLNYVLELIEVAKKELGIPEKQYVYFGATDRNLDQCELALQREEVVGLKIYPISENGEGVTTGTIGVAKIETLSKAMKLARKYKKVVAVHCACPKMFKENGYDSIAGEVFYLEIVAGLAKEIRGAKLLICHVSNSFSARYIIMARRRLGINIAMEFMPHYLWFDSEGTNWNPCLKPEFYHCYNSLRESRHREYLVSLLKADYPFIICASDTAGHTKAEKLAGFGGIPSSQELPAVIITLAKKHGISDRRVSDLLAFNQANFLGIPVNRELVRWRLKKRIDEIKYNNGRIINPWNGTELLFSERVKEAVLNEII